MREIIFRGKRADNGEWVNGNLYTDKNKTEILKLCVWENYNNREVVCNFPIDKATVGQFIGVKDKDGNKIFEGDIVECVSWNEYFSDPTTGKVMEPFRRRMEVVFMAGGFKLVEHLPQPCKDNVWNMIVEGDLTVIGNIHDNPELLK